MAGLDCGKEAAIAMSDLPRETTWEALRGARFLAL
jgi:hypothetical protein